MFLFYFNSYVFFLYYCNIEITTTPHLSFSFIVPIPRDQYSWFDEKRDGEGGAGIHRSNEGAGGLDRVLCHGQRVVILFHV
jgi:hypothetical protein